MQTLYNPKMYPKEIQAKLNLMPPLAIEIANRWALGWPKTVKGLMATGEYLDALTTQEQQERKVLSQPGNSHLARHEIVQEYGLSLAPPGPSNLESIEMEPSEMIAPTTPGLFDKKKQTT